MYSLFKRWELKISSYPTAASPLENLATFPIFLNVQRDILEKAKEAASDPLYKQNSRKNIFLCYLFLYNVGPDNNQSVHSSKQNYSVKEIYN